MFEGDMSYLKAGAVGEERLVKRALSTSEASKEPCSSDSEAQRHEVLHITQTKTDT